MHLSKYTSEGKTEKCENAETYLAGPNDLSDYERNEVLGCVLFSEFGDAEVPAHVIIVCDANEVNRVRQILLCLNSAPLLLNRLLKLAKIFQLNPERDGLQIQTSNSVLTPSEASPTAQQVTDYRNYMENLDHLMLRD